MNPKDLAANHSQHSLVLMKRKKDETLPTDSNEGREPNRSIQGELPHQQTLQRLQKFELRKKLEKLGVEEATLAKMTYREMQDYFGNLEE